MKLFLIVIAFMSCLTYALPVPVTYTQNGKKVTLEGVKHKNGYGYNLKADTLVRLVTLNWPPYIDDNLCNKGWLYQLTISMLVKKGYGVHIEFYPWARAVREAELGKADILFPAYFISDSVMSENILNTKRNNLLALSEPIPGGNLSFVALKDTHIEYTGNLSSIKKQRIGVIRAYKNTDELDGLIKRGEINTMVANSEYQLIHLLLTKRVDLIVADLDVLKASIYKSPLPVAKKDTMLNALQALQPSLEYKPLYYEISKSTPNWQTVLSDINSEIHTLSKNNELENFKREKMQQCYFN